MVYSMTRRSQESFMLDRYARVLGIIPVNHPGLANHGKDLLVHRFKSFSPSVQPSGHNAIKTSVRVMIDKRIRTKTTNSLNFLRNSYRAFVLPCGERAQYPRR